MKVKSQTNITNGGNFSKTRPEEINRQQMLMKRMKWFKQKLIDFPKNDGKTSLTRDQITQLRTEALQLFKKDYWLYEQQKSSGSKADEFEWIKNVLSNGTVNDKLAAHTVLIQDSAIHNVRSVESILRFINPKGKRECMLAIDNLRDLFIGDLLIPKEKLSTFEDLIKQADVNWLMGEDGTYRDGQRTDRERFLILSHFEDQIRSNYKKFIDSLIIVGQDSLETMKTKSIQTLFSLFISNGEQERHLLSSLVNKLGDPLPKIASKTAHLLSKILSKHHPGMKTIIVKEVERLLFRSNATERSQYYCLCFLTEIMFQTTDTDLSNNMIDIYLSFFNNLIKSGEVNNKMMAMILTGVSRAFPYSKLEVELLEKYLTTFYKIIHYVNLNTGIQTLALIMNIVDFRESGSLTDRFYSVLYRFCTNSQLDHCHKTNTLLNVVYQAMKKDPIIKRIRAFSKRLTQYALISYTPFTISVLVLISEILKLREGFQIESLLLKNQCKPISGENSLKNSDFTLSINYNDEDDDEENEIYYDAPEEEDHGDHNDDGEDQIKVKENKAQTIKLDMNEHESKSEKISASWVHIKNQKADSAKICHSYQPDVRNPLYTNVECEKFWELFTMQQHYHPTTRLFADNILNKRSIEYDGNPLDDFTVKRFLDRFVFRNPKSNVKNKTNNVFSRKQIVNSQIFTPKELLDMDEKDVPVDQKYIYKYLMDRKSMKLNTKTGYDDYVDDSGSDLESVNSDEFNAALDGFECDGDIDFADNFKKNKYKKKVSSRNDEDEEEEADFDEEFDGEFSDFDEDLEEISSFNNNNEDENEGEFGDDVFADMDLGTRKSKKAKNTASFTGKKGFSKITNDIFESAQEFSNILGENDSDSDFEIQDDKNDKLNHKVKNNFGKTSSTKSIHRAANKKLSFKRKRMGRNGHKNAKKVKN